MKVMSFNTQHCLNYTTKVIDYQIMADAITGLGADIVGLNEMRDKGESIGYEAQTAKLSELTGMKYHYFAKAIDVGGNNPYGNAILSKYPIEKAEVIPVPDPTERKYRGNYETRCLLKVKLTNGITVMIIHFGLNPDEQENAVKTVLDNLEDTKCVLMGDFNVEPDNTVLDPIRERMSDTANVFEKELLSFPSKNAVKKIDYIFVSKDVDTVCADIPEIIASDHRPHFAELKF